MTSPFCGIVQTQQRPSLIRRANRLKEHYPSLAKLCLHVFGSSLVSLLLVIAAGAPVYAQTEPWFRAGTGLGDLNKPRVAVADFAARADSAKPHSQLFTQVVRDDLQFSGIVELISPSFYPMQVPTVPAELRNPDWTTPQINANLAAFRNLTAPPSEVVISGLIYDARSTSNQSIVVKCYAVTP